MNGLREPWLAAAWPGMGAVALLAAQHLVKKLGGEPLGEVAAGEHFHPAGVEVRDGLLVQPRAPRTLLSGWHRQGRGHDLVVLLGEQQPAAASWRHSQAVLDVAKELEVKRVLTFAAMATTAPPRAPARVFVAATEPALLTEVRRLEAEPIRAGEIGGMNGLLLAAAAERRIPGACLLGEIPFYAGAVSNPKAAAAVLRVFARLANVRLELEELDRAGAEVERQLAEHHEKLERAARAIQEATAGETLIRPRDEDRGERDKREEDELTPADRARIEDLFAQAKLEHAKAIQLKAELDRLGVFARFEDRFLDLFKRAE